jgi:hypothetical protein
MIPAKKESANMIRRIRLALLLVLLTAGIAAVSIQTGAASIGEILGWDTSEDDGSGGKPGDRKTGKKKIHDQKTEKPGTGSQGFGDGKEGNSKASGKSDDYYETLDVDEDGSYDTKDEVCAYLVRFHRLPDNYMTKKEARKLGWEGGPLNEVISGKCIGGDDYGNYEGTLPEAQGREYHECDIDTLAASRRGAKRIIYSGDDEAGDWNIYYTDDHYETFTLLWGEDEYE